MFTAVALLVTLDAYGCGESLFRVGGPHRTQTAPLPGNVLFVVPGIETNVLFVEAIALAERLDAAGHHVRVIQSADAIGDELHKAKYDVVLAAYDDRKVVASEISGTTAKYVPIVTDERQREPAAAAYERYVSCADDFTEFLRVIHRSLRA
jgi:hypothetical protein